VNRRRHRPNERCLARSSLRGPRSLVRSTKVADGWMLPGDADGPDVGVKSEGSSLRSPGWSYDPAAMLESCVLACGTQE
jgi:hypothetical protein